MVAPASGPRRAFPSRSALQRETEPARVQVATRRWTPVSSQTVASLVAVGALGALAGYIGVPDGAKKRPPPAVSDPGLVVRLDGVAVALEPAGAPERDVARAAAGALARAMTLIADGAPWPVARTRGAFGVTVDVHQVAARLDSVRDLGSALRRGHDARSRGAPLALPMPLSVDRSRAILVLLQAHDDLSNAPTPARWDADTARAVPSALGRRLDVFATLARLDDALARGTDRFDAVFESVTPSRLDAEVAGVDATDVLGYFETAYPRGEAHAARTHNAKAAALKVDGWVVPAGETFDFNAVVGPRTDDARLYASAALGAGEPMDGASSAVAHVAGTLHGAALLAGLEIVERHAATRASEHVPMGLESVVTYGGISLRFRNSFASPIVLRATVSGGVVRAEVLGSARDRTVSVVRSVTRVVRFPERTTEDPRLPRGERVLVRRGTPGVSVAATRIVRLADGSLRESRPDDAWTTVYAPTPQVWRIGTGDPDAVTTAFAKRTRDDARPEALFDETVTLTQGPDAASARTPHEHDGSRNDASPRGGFTMKTRVAGRYATPGWTVREGFSKFVSGAGKHVEAAKSLPQETPAPDDGRD